MRHSRIYWTLSLLLLAAVGTTLIWNGSRPQEVVAGTQEHTGVPSGRTARHPARSEDPGRREARTQLRLEIVDGQGKRLHGQVLWKRSDTPILEYPFLSSLAKEEASRLEIHVDRHRGTVDLPAGRWIWLEVSGRRTDRDPIRRAHKLYRPSDAGMRRLVLDDEKRGLHIQVLRPDLLSGLPEAQVRILRQDLEQGGPPVLFRTITTDAYGQMQVSPLPMGAYLLLAPGATIDSRPPYMDRVILAKESPLLDVPSVIVAREPRHSIRIQVDAAFHKTAGKPPLLYLKQVGSDLGLRLPMRGSLSPGTQEVEFAAPDGDYEIGILPQGRLTLDDARILSIEHGIANLDRLTLRDASPQTTVSLEGLRHKDLPVTIRLLPPDQLLDESHHLYFTGPRFWRVTRLKIRVPREPMRWLAYSKFGYWLSSEILSPPASRQMKVVFRPASRVQVRWRGVKALKQTCHLVVDSADGESFRVMTRVLAPMGTRKVRMMVGTVVVPRGRVRIDCLSTEDGKQLWTRDVTADRTYVNVDLPDTPERQK